jgi:hypothetical protein
MDNDLNVLETFDDTLIECLTELGLFSNGGEECDVVDGPCACGAWHSRQEMVTKLENYFYFGKQV